MLEIHEHNRRWRSLFYGLLALGCAILITDPFQSIEGLDAWIRWWWSGSLLFGSTLSFVGSILDRWKIEWAGLPLQGVCIVALDYIFLSYGLQNSARIATACFFSALLPVMAGRFLGLKKLASAEKKVAQRERGN